MTDARPATAPVWVDLTTPDPGGAARFYSELLGWTTTVATTPTGDYTIAVTTAGTAGGMMAPAPGEQGPPAWAVCFGVDDVDRAVAHAESIGASVLQAPMDLPGEGGRIGVVTDPAGAAVALIGGTGEPVTWGAPGGPCWVETQTRDLAASRRFYEELFPWTAVEGEGGYWMFTDDGSPVAGMMTMPPEVPAAVPSYWLVYFGVTDVDASVAVAVRLGGSVLAPPMSAGDMRFAVVADPWGAAFGLLGV